MAINIYYTQRLEPMISLEKYGDTTYVDWSKSTPNSLSNGIVIELRWTFIEMRERRNFFRTKYDKLAHFMKNIFIGDEDLDLGIYYEMKDGTKSLIDPVQFNKRGGAQNMQKKQGRFTQLPYVWHQGDDRGAGETSGERIYVNPKGLRDIKKLYVYAFIWRGVPHWYKTDAKLEIKVGGQSCVLVNLDQTEQKERFCVAAEISTDGNMLEVKKLSTFHKNHSACDSAYGWNFKWTSGTK